jgi:hypothetical protein
MRIRRIREGKSSLAPCNLFYFLYRTLSHRNLCLCNFFIRGFFRFVHFFIQHCFICRPSESTVSEDAEIEPRTVATTALAVRHSNPPARSHPNTARSHPQSARSHPQSANSQSQLGQISSTTRLDLIHNSARSYPHSARSHPPSHIIAGHFPISPKYLSPPVSCLSSSIEF